MYHKCELEFIYKPAGLFSDEKSFISALTKFFSQEGYMMQPIDCQCDDDMMYMIEPVEKIAEKPKTMIKIPYKK
jgi:hypothetical protein